MRQKPKIPIWDAKVSNLPEIRNLVYSALKNVGFTRFGQNYGHLLKNIHIKVTDILVDMLKGCKFRNLSC